MNVREVFRQLRERFRVTNRIDPPHPYLTEELEQGLSERDQLVNTIARGFHMQGKDPRKHKREIYQQAHEAEKSWMNR